MSDILENKDENLQEISEEVTQEVAPEIANETVEATAEETTEENLEVFSEEVTEFLEEETKAEQQVAHEKKHLIKNKIVREIVSWIGTILLAVIIAIVINTYFFRISRVSGDSMLQTYKSGETVFVTKLPYIFGDVEKNEVVILDSTLEKRTFFTDIYESLKYNAISYKIFGVEQPKKYFIKRVIAVAGDTLQIKEDGVYVNGKLLDEPYVNNESKPNYSKVSQELKNGVTVPDGHIFVMGDNRNHSRDSRDSSIGFVPVNDVLGKVIGT
ncbi:MAG: signal peptidase I [Ruminococcaceae bacterium]|nr:signal peptidase I [Oscillospiraceae bacterium]